MARFAYQARDANGRALAGHVEAANAGVVAAQLSEIGAIPLTIAPAEADTRTVSVRQWFKSNVKIDELIIFSHQMATLAKAGISVVRAVRGLAESARNPRLAQALDGVANDLEAGVDFATSLKRHGDVFSSLYASVIHVGENTGRLDEAFRRIAQYLELERETIKRLKSATRYPSFVLIAIGVAITILNMFVIPAFANVFAKFHAAVAVADAGDPRSFAVHRGLLAVSVCGCRAAGVRGAPLGEYRRRSAFVGSNETAAADHRVDFRADQSRALLSDIRNGDARGFAGDARPDDRRECDW